ncbi:hypothetical protein [Cellulomonas soli]
MGNSGDAEQDAFWLAIDSMLFQIDGSKPPLAVRLLKFDRALAPAQRALLERWTGGVPHGFFEVTRVEHDHGTLRSLDSGVTYPEVHSLLGEWESGALVRGDVLWARLLPCGDAWLPSTPLAGFPEDLRADVRRVAAMLPEGRS